MKPQTSVSSVPRRRSQLRPWLIALAVLIALGLGSTGPWTQYLWFAEDVKKPEVFTLAYKTEGQLFFFGFFVAWLLLFFSLRQAFKWSVIYTTAPATPGAAAVARLVEWLQAKGQDIVRFASPVLAILVGSGLAGSWRDWLLFQHAQAFGVQDPMFGFDLGFFVFRLPLLRDFAGWLSGLAVLTTILCCAIIFGLQTLATTAKVELSRPQVRTLVSLLFGFTMISFALRLGIGCYEYGYLSSTQFTGAGYAGTQQMWLQAVAAICLLAAGLATMLNARFGRPYRAAVVGAGASALVYVLGVGIWPQFVQWATVNPNRIAMEAPFAQRAVKMTHFGYGLDKIEVKDFDAADAPSPAEIAEAGTTLQNMRLWDPKVMQQSIEVLQGLRSYYTFRDVDVDRYPVDGKQTMVMVSSRDINPTGLSENAQSWVNTHLIYTHGFGVTVSPVNAATSQGRPTFLVRDLPPKASPGFEVAQPRLYYTDTSEQAGETPILVDTNSQEFDYPAQDGDKTNRWTGNRGIQIGGLLRKLAFAIQLGDTNILISSNVTADTRLLINRGVRERAEKVYTFLKFDSDPYVVIHDGRLLWMLDGYTTSDMIPYSEEVQTEAGGLNYIRNSVKVVVDAYSGEMDAYAVEPDEPILRAFRAIYPGLIRDLSDLPKGLDSHFRYPEDMFRLQTQQLSQYHVTDARVFLGNGDAWSIPFQRSLNGQRMPIDPYYVQMRLPDEPKDGFLLIRPFTPLGKTNMSGWLAAHCDPGSYGRLVLYKYPKNTAIAGPEQVEANFIQDPTVARINREFNNDQSQVVVGNLLVIPIGKSVMYVEPLFLQSRVQGIAPIPELKKVVLGVKDRVVVGDTYAEALAKLFAVEAPPTVTGSSTPPVSPQKTSSIEAFRKELAGILDQADAALKRGDWAAYGALQKKLRDRLANP